MLAKLNKFYQTDLTEISFKKCFQGYLCSMPMYDSPNNYKKQLKIEELQKMAKKLSDFINISEEQAYFFTKKMCYQNSQDKWDADLLFKTIESYDPELLSSILYPQVAINAA